LVHDTFCEEDAKIFLHIPMDDGPVDFIAWHFQGHQSNRLTNWTSRLNSTSVNSIGASSDALGTLNSRNNSFWKQIWTVAAPDEIMMFTWRYMHNSLVLRANLELGGVHLEDCKCLLWGRVLWGRVDEDATHFVFEMQSNKGDVANQA
jgi:hypothetical protein